MGGSDTDHLSPPAVKVKNVWSYTSTLPYASVMWCLFKQAYNGWLVPTILSPGAVR